MYMKLFHHHQKDVEKSLAQQLPDESGSSARMIRHVVTIGCIVNACLMVMKLAAGYFGHSDALVADGFHSLNDLAADLIMLIFVGISYRAADARYAYGYGKFETFSSFLISTFLILVAGMIMFEAVESVIAYCHGEVLPQPDIWTLVVILFAMASKEGLYRYYSAAGRKCGSKALIANAWHHRSDALASVATLIGVSCAYFFGESFRILDPVASFVIAIFILVPAVRLFVPAFSELMERSLPAADVEKARMIIEETPGVEKLYYLRTRRNGHQLVFDASIGIERNLSVEQGDKIVNEVTSGLVKAFCPHVLVSVATRPA